MRNINELLGIIRGVSFDKIVNDKELEKLQSWAINNRSLVFDASDIELVNVVEEILEDNIITEEEQELLCIYVDEYLEKLSTDLSKVDEFNGVIDGIICDGEINEKEIYALLNWINKTHDHYIGNKNIESIVNKVNEVVSDGLITEEEKKDLFIYFAGSIDNAQFEAKLTNLKTMIRSGKNIGVELLSFINDEKTLNKIHARTENQLKLALSSYTGTSFNDPEIVFISLVLIAMLKYDGNYYDHIEELFPDLYDEFPNPKIENSIRTVVKKFCKNPTKMDRSRIINIPLGNAIVPSYYLKDFFEFVYDIYEWNLLYSLPANLYDEFKFVYNSLKRDRIDNDILKVSVTKKSYKLIKSTKALMRTEEGMKSLINLSVIVVKLIDKSVKSGEIQSVNAYFSNGYNEWFTNNRKKYDRKNITRHSHGNNSSWQPVFHLDKDEVLLIPPRHSVKEGVDYRTIRIEVRNDNNLVYECDSDKIDIREIIGGYKISTGPIKLINPLGKVKYVLLSKDEILYESAEKLFRDFIVFNSDGIEINNNTDYKGDVVFCYNKILKCPVNSFIEKDKYSLFLRNVNVGDFQTIGKSIFNFSSKILAGIIGDEHENTVARVGNEEGVKVYKCVEQIMFESTSMENNIILDIDGRITPLKVFKYNMIEMASSYKYVVLLDLKKCGVHSLLVYELKEHKKNQIFKNTFIVDEDLKVKTFFGNHESYKVHITSSLITNEVIEEISIDSFDKEWFRFNFDNTEFTYYLPLDIDMYCIDRVWKGLEQDIWIDEISNDTSIDIWGAGISELQVLDNNHIFIEDFTKKLKKMTYITVNIGFLQSYKEIPYLFISFSKKNIKKEIRILNQCYLDEQQTDIYFNSDTNLLELCPYFYGKNKIQIKIINQTDEVFKSTPLVNEEKVFISGLESFVKYNIGFYEVSQKGFFGKTKLIKTIERIFYSYESMVGNVFKITLANFDEYDKTGEYMEHKNLKLNSQYVKFLEYRDGKFIGEIFSKKSRGTYYLKNINPVTIELCGEEQLGQLEVSMITPSDDGLLLDRKYQNIMNNAEDHYAPDIFSYILEMEDK